MTRDRAICLRRLDYSETSQILSIFARRHGLMRVIAKGAKRTTKAGHGKFDGGLDLLDVGEAVFIHSPDKDLSTLTEWTLVEGHLELRDSLRAMYLAQYAAELVSLLFSEHDAHAEVFDDLEAVIPELHGPRAEEAFLAFEFRLLFAAGVMPELNRCASCGNIPDERSGPDERGQAFFSAAVGGVLCRSCEAVYPERFSFDPRLTRLCRTLATAALPRGYSGPRPQLLSLRLPKLTRLQSDPVNRLLLEHVRYITSRNPRLAEYILAGYPTRRVVSRPVASLSAPRAPLPDAPQPVPGTPRPLPTPTVPTQSPSVPPEPPTSTAENEPGATPRVEPAHRLDSPTTDATDPKAPTPEPTGPAPAPHADDGAPLVRAPHVLRPDGAADGHDGSRAEPADTDDSARGRTAGV